jgi:hypothetical protein
MASNAENYANGIFAKAMADLYREVGRLNVRGTLVNDVQVEFCYLMKTMQECPEYVKSKFVTKIEALIEKTAEFVATLDALKGGPYEFDALGRKYDYINGAWRRAT